MEMTVRIYVASSWRNDYQPEVVRGLRELDHEVYDFKHPVPGNEGFHWSEIGRGWKSWTLDEYTEALKHPIAEAGFTLDFAAMMESDACVLVLPCGRSAHIEAGYFVGANKPLLILLSSEQFEPELMYKMATGVFTGLGPLLLKLQDIEDAMRA